MINTEKLLTKWTQLDLAIKRVQHSTPDKLSEAVAEMEHTRDEYHQEMITFVRNRLAIEAEYSGSVPLAKDGKSVWIDGCGQVFLQQDE